MPLAIALTLNTVKALAGDKAFARGLAYFHEGAVGLVQEEDETLTASVQGTHRYHVRLAAEHDALDYNCTCPVGDDGDFCKHAVAVALSWLENTGEEVFPPDEVEKRKKKRPTKAEQLRQYLETLPETRLRDLLMEAADRDRNFRDKLLFTAKSATGKSVTDLRSIIRQATRISGYGQDAYDYAERLNDLAELLEKRLADGNVELIELIEDAIAQAESGQQQIDDSDGESYGAIERLAELHLEACLCLNPPPVALAERLFAYQMNSDCDTFYSILPAYAPVLGQAGQARYAELVEAQWSTLPPLTAAQGYRQNWDAQRNRLERAMTELARQRGDIDALVAIKSRDLSAPYHYLRIAEQLKEHQRFDEALAWVEKGIAAFPKDPRIDDLLTFAIEEQQRRNDPDAVEKLAWQCFEQRPNSEAFFLLLKTAKQLGRLDSLRTQALKFLEEKMSREEKSGQKASAWMPCTRNTLLEIHLAEKNAEAMWSTLKGGPTNTMHWTKCAAMRGKTHPQDAIELYFKLLPMKIEDSGYKARYEDAFNIVQAIGKLRAAQGKSVEFMNELARIRLEYKAKRNFIKLLAVLG